MTEQTQELKSAAIDALEQSLTDTMFFIDNHKDEIVDELFGAVASNYRKEWYDRDVFAFWLHLDIGNRKRVLEMIERKKRVAEARVERERHKLHSCYPSREGCTL